VVSGVRTFGAYDPRFLGTQVTLNSNEAVATFNEFYVDRKVFQFDPLDPRAVDKVWLGTVLEHEVRHFHDALISPYSAKLLRLRLEIATNFDQVFNDMVAAGFETGCNCVPVPAEKWIELSEQERGVLIADFEATGFFGANLRPLPMPVIPNQIASPAMLRADSILEYPVFPPLSEGFFSSYGKDEDEARRLYMLRMAILKDHYDQVDFLLRGLPFSRVGNLQPWEVFEAAAVTVQMVAAHESCVGFSANDFLRQLATDAPRYIRALLPFIQVHSSDGPLIPRAVLIASTWAILSGEVFGKDMKDWDVGEAQGSPAARYAGAIAWFKRVGLPRPEASVFKIFRDLDESLGCSVWKQNVELSLVRNLSLAEKIEGGLKPTADANARKAVQAYCRFVDNQRDLLTSGAFDLDQYTRPDKYLALANRLPQPPTIFHVQNLGMDPAEFALANVEAGWFPVEYVEGNGKAVVSVAMGPHASMSTNQLADVWHLFNYLREIDHFFSRHHRNEHRSVYFDRLFRDHRFNWIEIQ